MTAEQFVKQYYPSATCTRETMCLDDKYITYWHVKMRNASEPIAVGKSESNAWVEAKKSINVKTI